MPAPVSFTISLAPLPALFEGTLQEWAAAVADRLTITPAEPWSSFQNGGALGSSDVGPVLLDGLEWRVFDTGSGAYTYHRQNGAGLVDSSVPLTKLSDGANNCLMWFDSTGSPNAIQPGTDGQVLSMASGTVAWADAPSAPGNQYFEATVSNSHALATNGDTTTVQFDSVKVSNGVAYDTANYRVTIPAGQTWFFYCSLQIEDDGTASTDVQINSMIGSPDNVCVVRNYPTAQSRDGYSWSGLIRFEAERTISVSLSATESGGGTPTGLSVAGNQGNTRFGGYRIA